MFSLYFPATSSIFYVLRYHSTNSHNDTLQDHKGDKGKFRKDRFEPAGKKGDKDRFEGGHKKGGFKPWYDDQNGKGGYGGKGYAPADRFHHDKGYEKGGYGKGRRIIFSSS